MKTKKAKITNKTDIKALAESYGLRFRGRKTFCPFHEEATPSLHLNKNNTLHCFGCDKHLNPEQFVYEMEKLGNKPEEITLKEFTGKQEIKKPDNSKHWAILTDIINNANSLQNSPDLSSYFNRRGINPYLASKMSVRYLKGSRGLGFLYDKYDSKDLSEIGVNSLYHSKELKDQELILLPYIDLGNVKSIKLRNLRVGKEKVYLALGNIGNKLYNEQVIYTDEEKELIITEGEIKTLALLSNGYKAVGVPSRSAFKRKNIELLLSMNKKSRIILNPDYDTMVEGYRIKFELKREGYKVASLVTEKDIDEVLLEEKDLNRYILD